MYGQSPANLSNVPFPSASAVLTSSQRNGTPPGLLPGSGWERPSWKEVPYAPSLVYSDASKRSTSGTRRTPARSEAGAFSIYSY
jgi:hypothetical protein